MHRLTKFLMHNRWRWLLRKCMPLHRSQTSLCYATSLQALLTSFTLAVMPNSHRALATPRKLGSLVASAVWIGHYTVFALYFHHIRSSFNHIYEYAENSSRLKTQFLNGLDTDITQSTPLRYFTDHDIMWFNVKFNCQFSMQAVKERRPQCEAITFF